ncbi:MAG: FHA domain-containing protein [Planctomycetota bacterium]
MAKLILRAADGSTTELPLEDRGSVTIGRSPECDLPIQDGQASRRHCMVVRLQSGHEVADLGSTNGTTVNGQLVKKKRLQHGDKIRIGAVEVVFQDPDAAGAAGTEIANGFLVFAKGERKGEKRELTQQRTTVGRKETNTLVLKDTVASSYHCEIVRDLNGYTIRDLGSTNGTLVNGETVTEAQLTHGAKIRIGNTRLVFQDPAMAEIDLELAAVEDEEPEWGMMRDLDLAAVRRRNPATIFYTALFLAILGGGAYLLKLQQSGSRETGPTAPAGNLHDPYSFESSASAFLWDSDPVGAAETRWDTERKASGKSSMEVRARAEATDLFYGGALPGRDVRYRLQAKVASAGAQARIGILWRGVGGLSEWNLADAAAGGGFRAVELSISSPPWALTARLGMRIRGQGTVHLDDVSLVLEGRSAAQQVELNEFALVTVGDASATLLHAGAPILAKGSAFARDAAGADLPAAVRIACEKEDEAHLRVRLALSGGDAASALGLRLEEVNGYLGSGFRAFGDRVDGTNDFVGAAPDEGEQRLERIRKLLVGPKGRAFAVLGAGDARLKSEVRVADGVREWSLLGEPKDGACEFRIKVDLRGEARQAQDEITATLALFQGRRLGDFLEKAPQVLAEFPFAAKPMRTQLQEAMAHAQQEFDAMAREAQDALKDYEQFKDLQSLEVVRQGLAKLAALFQVKEGEGARGDRYAALRKEEAAFRQEAEQKRQRAQADPLLQQALLFHKPSGETHSAAVLLYYIVRRLPESPQAREAQVELEQIRASHPHVLEVLERLPKE